MPTIDEAARFALRNRAQLAASTQAACYHCRERFPPAEVLDWTDQGETAVCPRCGVDTVIGNASGFPLDERTLAALYARWFSA